jgi:transposase
VISDLMGVSGRKMIEALIAGRRDPAKLARLADPRVKASQETLRQALRGRMTGQHRFLLHLHLDQIDAIDAAIAKIDQEVERNMAPFRTAVEQVSSVPGVKLAYP